MAFDRSSLESWQQQSNIVRNEQIDKQNQITNVKLNESNLITSNQEKRHTLEDINSKIESAQQLQQSLPTLGHAQTDNENLKNELENKKEIFNYLTGLIGNFQRIEGVMVDSTVLAAKRFSSNGVVSTDLVESISKNQCKEAFDIAFSKLNDINYQDSEGKTILMKTITNGFYYGVDKLLKSNADANILDNKGANALFYCAQMPHIKYFKLIAEKTIDVNFRLRSYLRSSYLHVLVENTENILFASELNSVFKGYDCTMNGKLFVKDEDFTESYTIGKVREDGYTINQEKTLHLIEYLCEKGLDINVENDNGVTPLYLSCQHKLKYLSQHLIDNYAIKWDIIDNFYGYNILQWVLQLNDTSIIRQIILKGIDINHQDREGKTTLFWAVHYRYLDIVALLYDQYNARDISSKSGVNAWDLATFRVDEDLINILVTKRNVQRKYVDLWCACKKGDVLKAKELLENGIDPNITIGNMNHSTPFIQAISNNHIDVVELLLKHKADVNRTDKNGVSPLYYSLGYGSQQLVSTDIVSLLILNGANVNQVTSSGNTPLHMACYKCNTEAVKLLIENKSTKDIQNKDKKTPLDLLDNKTGFELNSDLAEIKLLFQNN